MATGTAPKAATRNKTTARRRITEGRGGTATTTAPKRTPARSKTQAK